MNIEERVEELENIADAAREDINLFKQNLFELSNQIDTECVPLQQFEREIRFLKTMIEEFTRLKTEK